MARRRISFQGLTRGVIGAVVVASFVACEATSEAVPVAQDPVRYQALQSEVIRLSEKVTALEGQLLFEQRNAARARQETQLQRERILALETTQPPSVSPAEHSGASEAGEATRSAPPNLAAHMQVEAELKLAYRALMRAIERLDISSEEKAALKGSLRPTRSLDHENPWSVAKY